MKKLLFSPNLVLSPMLTYGLRNTKAGIDSASTPLPKELTFKLRRTYLDWKLGWGSLVWNGPRTVSVSLGRTSWETKTRFFVCFVFAFPPLLFLARSRSLIRVLCSLKGVDWHTSPIAVSILIMVSEFEGVEDSDAETTSFWEGWEKVGGISVKLQWGHLGMSPLLNCEYSLLIQGCRNRLIGEFLVGIETVSASGIGTT